MGACDPMVGPIHGVQVPVSAYTRSGSGTNPRRRYNNFDIVFDPNTSLGLCQHRDRSAISCGLQHMLDTDFFWVFLLAFAL